MNGIAPDADLRRTAIASTRRQLEVTTNGPEARPFNLGHNRIFGSDSL